MKQDKKHRSLKMKTVAKALMVLIACLALSSCYHKKENKQHYGRNYNFVIKADSMAIIEQQPEEIVTFLPTDTLYVRHNDHIVVADKRILNNDLLTACGCKWHATKKPLVGYMKACC